MTVYPDMWMPYCGCLHFVCSGYEESAKPNVFAELVRPRFSDTPRRRKSIQGEIHVVITPTKIDASILIHKVLSIKLW